MQQIVILFKFHYYILIVVCVVSILPAV